eukprot:symbB.v1.2.025738.t1/scaffold2505.1/size135028/2
MLTVPRLIGFGIAFAIYKLGATAKYDSHMKGFHAEDGYGWLYLGVYFFAMMVSFVNLFPMYYKGKAMKANAGNLRANMFIYKVLDGGKKHVVMEEEGGIGEYNRANRSLGHFVENAAGFLLCVPFAGYIFPFPTFILMAIMICGRIVHQMGYASGGYGKHAPGFMLHLISQVSIEGLVLYTGIQLF